MPSPYKDSMSDIMQGSQQLKDSLIGMNLNNSKGIKA